MSVADFLNAVRKTHQTGAATEHSYRPALQKLFNSLDPAVSALNEPKRVKVGAPDFVFRRGEISVGHCEAKDIDIDVRTKKGPNAEQKTRYLGGLPNLIYTNCLDWVFYRDGEEVAYITIADFLMGIQPRTDQFGALEHRLRDFIAQTPQSITSPKDLAERMAGKAVLIKDILFNSLKEDKDRRTELNDQYAAFKEHLIHDISAEDFADMYAETIAYGMFAARLHDPTLNTFSRHEAMELLPKSNPFLRNLFGYIAGPNLDERISWIIDDLAKVFQATNVRSILEKFGTTTQRNDPFLHFYETFLAAYNPAKRKARGVWYTPEPVVNFIVRAVDEILKADFDLSLGLADTSKVTIDWDTGQRGLTKKGKIAKAAGNATTKKQVHRVQILDPATGTGTFLAEAIKQIAPQVKNIAPASWSAYVEKDLIPRLHGFELLMASYAMCHMKLDMILTELKYKPTANPPRLGVYLTNSLEEGDPPNQTLPFAQWLSNEVREANTVKRDMPIMCVLGNPPYNNSSSNKSEWILGQIAQYKTGLDETKINLDDDYIKFIRFAEALIERNEVGVIGFITNNSFLDGATHRRMREHLLNTFDKIYICNLHGDIRNQTTALKSGRDENVFDITQGVSISLCVKSQPEKSGHAEVLYVDQTGDRAAKYKFLSSNTLKTAGFEVMQPQAPYFYLVPKDDTGGDEYREGIDLSKLFISYSSGIQTKRDGTCVQFSKDEVQAVVDDFRKLDDHALRDRYELPDDGRDWTVAGAKSDVKRGDGTVIPFLYRPFDKRYTYYSGRTKGFLAYPRREIMQSIVGKRNFGLIANRQTAKDYFSFVGVSSWATCHGTFYLGNRGQDYLFPLYVYPPETELDRRRRVNFDEKLFASIKERGTDRTRGEPDEVAVFDYIYGALHCPAYRERYADFLKMDFPRVPWPSSAKVFWNVSGKGTQLRQLHLMEDDAIGEARFPFKGDGDGVVDRPEYRDGKIWINAGQYFEKPPEVSWDFTIGGYQPAQKWLKDRKDRALSFEEIRHYQKILKIMSETDKIMKTIDLLSTAEQKYISRAE